MNAYPQYARCLKAIIEHGEEIAFVGAVFPVFEQHVVIYHDHGTYQLEWDDERFAPATLEDFSQALAEASRHLNEVTGEHARLAGELTDAQAYSALADNALMTTTLGFTAAAVRNRALTFRREAGAVIQRLTVAKERVLSLVESQRQLARAAAEKMQAMVEDMEYVAGTINLYLGTAEEIAPLRDGTMAPAGTPLSVRQTVLCMDEEIALDHLGFGGDAIEVFDRWLLDDPKHLEQILPEPKGVVVLRARRHPRTGRDVSEEERDLDRRSYWLMRNGDRLHRVFAPVEVGDFLIPPATDPWIDEDGDLLRPGTMRYEQAMRQAKDERRRQMQVALVLQGLLDRTRLFEPFDGAKPNVLDPASWDGRLRLVTDAERALTDGRPTFHEWLKRVNGTIRRGLRITGSFPTYGDMGKQRMRPRYADGPNKEDYYTVQEGMDGGFYILFSREGEYNYRTGGRITKRGSYTVYNHDDFFVCIDNAEVADMEYYLNDRRHRKDYEHMVPALQKAVEVKRAETQAEQPFRDLLLKKLNEIAPCDEHTASQYIDWWKHKTVNHRPLLADDRKAYKMILSRFRNITASRNPSHERDLLSAVSTAGPGSVLLVQKTGQSDYAVFREIPSEPVYMDREEWQVNAAGVAVKTDTEHLVIPDRRKVFPQEIIHEAPAWRSWPTVRRDRKILPRCKEADLVEFAKTVTDDESRLLVVLREGEHYQLVTASPAPKEANASPLEWDELQWDLKPYYIYWNKDFEFYTRHPHHSLPVLEKDGELYGVKGENGDAVWLDRDLVAQIEVDCRKIHEHNEQSERLCAWVTGCEDLATEALERRWEDAEKEKFLADGGEAGLFADHLKTLFKPNFTKHPVRKWLESLLGKSIPPESLTGRTAGELGKLAEMAPTADVSQLDAAHWQTPALPVEEDEQEDDSEE
jgi:hypothetical protein